MAQEKVEGKQEEEVGVQQASDGAGTQELLALLKGQTELMAAQQRTMAAMGKTLSAQGKTLAEQGRMLEVLGKVSLREMLAEIDETIQDRQLSMLQTIELVAAGASLATWGDGEIRLMLQPEHEEAGQRADPTLSAHLKRVLRDHDASYPELLLGFPTVYVSRLWMGIWAENWHRLSSLLRMSRAPWANTHVARPLFFSKHADEAVEAWRGVWEGKDVCVVAGEGAPFVTPNALFDSAASLRRIDGAARDAYDGFEDLVRKVQEAPRADVYLCSLGATGSILSAHLASQEGGRRHAIDVGHLGKSYVDALHHGKLEGGEVAMSG